MTDLWTHLSGAASAMPPPLGSAIPSTTPDPSPFSNAPSDQAAQVSNYLANPNIVLAQKPATASSSPTDVIGSWLSSLFDTSKPDDNPVGWAWHGFLRTMNWTYDRVNQAGTFALSALPGGSPTLSWDQANDISIGQEAVGNLIYDYNNLMGKQGQFDITKAGDRKAAFEDNLIGKIASGATDIAAMAYLDPYMVVGKAAKIGRLRYLDSAYTTEKLAAAVPVVTKQLEDHAAGLIGTKDMHPLAQLSVFIGGKNAEGKPLHTFQEIMAHPVLKGATDGENVASVLMAADNPDQAFTALRYMMGDVSARAKLLADHATLLDSINLKRKEQLEAMILHRPQDQAKMLGNLTQQVDDLHNAARKARDASRHARNAASPPDFIDAMDRSRDAAVTAFDNAVEQYRLVRDMKIPDPLSRMDKKAQGIRAADAQAQIDDMVQRDTFFQRALQGETDNANTLWNTLNQDRQETSWMQLFPGLKVDTAGAKGIPVDTPLGRLVEASREKRAIASGQQAQTRGQWTANYFGTSLGSRVLNLWRWAGNENPSGYIATDGAASQNAWREVAAQLNATHFMSGEAKVVEGGKAVGGIPLKDQLLRDFTGTWTDGSALDQVSRHNMLQNMEAKVINHMGAYYGLDEQDVETLIDKLQRSRNGIIDEIKKNKGYWVEDGKIHKAPFLESQLLNGTYMMDFRRIEEEMQRYVAEGWSRRGKETKAFIGDHAANLYDQFQSLWRPSVLLRLGYTQRNVVEGLIRSTAFMFSLDPRNLAAPVVDALKQGAYGARNMVAPKVTEKIAARVEEGIDSRVFARWWDRQNQAAADELTRIDSSIAAFTEHRNTLIAEGNTEAANVYDGYLRQYAQMRSGAEQAQRLLADRDIALGQFRQQGKMKKAVYSGTINADGIPMDQAFANKGYAPIAMANASSNMTRQYEANLTGTAVSRMIRDTVLKENVAVAPNDVDHYYKALAGALQQFKSDDVGRMIINGDDPRRIASYLMNTSRGRARAEMLRLSLPKGEEGFKVKSWQDALDYATQMTHRYNSLTATDQVRQAMRGLQPTEELLRPLLEGHADKLIPIVGDITQELGHSRLVDMYRKLTQVGFKWLGTIPEDAFVRIPFYGRRHQIAVESLVSDLKSQVGDLITNRDLQAIQETAHRRALADSKKWLYTIERRTNLGRIGEHVFPFISASQNSVTTFGRLIWNDPRVGVELARLWNAPEQMHIEDGQGNIVVPLPVDLIPEGIRKATGLDNMMSMKFNKNGLNVIFQMNNGNPLPTPGPLVTLPASELMKAGLFGGIDAPNILKEALGTDQANALWDGWKSLLFGSGQGVSENFLSYDMVLPPWLQKAIQMKEGELNSVQYATQYALQARTEMAKYLAGYRDTPPSADEIKTRTNNLYLVRILGNLTAFTPPQYVSKLQPLVDTIRANKQAYGLAGDRMNSELFGDYLTMLGDFSVTKNTAGMQSNVTAYANAKKYESLIGRIAPELGNNLNALGIILNNGNMTNALYDPSVRAWEQSSNIPGVTEHYLTMQSPQESLVQSQKNAGWTAYMKGMDVLDSILRQRGLKSYRATGAEDLKVAKQQLIQRLANDPAYGGWYSDFLSFGSTHTVSAVKVLTAAVNDRTFMHDNGASGLWQAAQQYLAARQQMVQGLISQDQWDAIRSDLQAYNTDWAALATRYLTNDDQPLPIGVSFGTMGG